MKSRLIGLPVVFGLAALFLASCSGSNGNTGNDAAPAAISSNTPATPAAAPVVETPAPEPKPAARPAAKAPKVAKAVPQPAPAPITPAVPVNPPSPPVAVQPAPAPAPIFVPEAPPAPTTKLVTLPSGTMIPIAMIDSVDSRTDHVGQTFRASIDSPVILDGQTVFPKGSNVFVKLTFVQSPGAVSGNSEIQLHLNRIFLGNKAYDVESNVFQTVGASQGKQAVRNTGIGAAIGAAIGAIAGGGKGAAIGAGVGAGGGAAATTLNKDQVRVDSESHLVFRLEEPLDVTVDLNAAANSPARRNSSSGSGPAPLGDYPNANRR